MMIVIRVDVPKELLKKHIQIHQVLAIAEGEKALRQLQILNAYVDTKGAPGVAINGSKPRKRL